MFDDVTIRASDREASERCSRTVLARAEHPTGDHGAFVLDPDGHDVELVARHRPV